MTLTLKKHYNFPTMRQFLLVFAIIFLFFRTFTAFAQPVSAQNESLKPLKIIPRASDARLSGDSTRTRLIIDLEKQVQLRAFTLQEPDRVIIDLEEVNFQLPPKTGQTGKGLIKAWRFGLFAPGKSRIVADLSAPALIDKAFTLEAGDGQPARLVLDLIKTDAKTIAEQKKASPSPVQDDLPQSSPRSPPVNANDNRPVIVIDVGHGGIDTGALAENGTAEKAIVLQFGLMLRDRLKESNAFNIFMTREDDSFISLGERVKLAREVKANLFISIHADAINSAGNNARGATIYTLSEKASDRDAARLAEKENKADAIAGIDLKDEPNEVQDFLIELTQRETKALSQNFSTNLVQNMQNSTRLHRIPQRAAGFKVLRAHDVPSVLIELGYISSPDDLSQMTNPAWRERVSLAVAKAVEAFFKVKR